MSDNQKELNTFIKSPAGIWFIQNINGLRTQHYERGEKDPVTASLELARAAGNLEVLNWINSQVAILKGK